MYERERDFEIKDAEVEKERELYRQRVGAPTTPTFHVSTNAWPCDIILIRSL